MATRTFLQRSGQAELLKVIVACEDRREPILPLKNLKRLSGRNAENLATNAVPVELVRMEIPSISVVSRFLVSYR